LAIVPAAQVVRLIFLIRGQRIITDADLAFLYGVTTKALNQQVRRNAERFPPDFMFQLTWDEAAALRSQIATLKNDFDSRSQIVTLNIGKDAQVPANTDVTSTSSRSQIVTLNEPQPRETTGEEGDHIDVPRMQIASLNRGRNVKYRPFAFTEHGAIMAATVLNSPNAVKASLFVVRAFVQLRELLSTHRNLAEKLNELERKLQDHDGQILGIIEAIRELMNEPEEPAKPPIGFATELEGKA